MGVLGAVENPFLFERVIRQLELHAESMNLRVTLWRIAKFILIFFRQSYTTLMLNRYLHRSQHTAFSSTRYPRSKANKYEDKPRSAANVNKRCDSNN